MDPIFPQIYLLFLRMELCSVHLFLKQESLLDNHSSGMANLSGFFMIWFLLKPLSAQQLLMANDTSILNKIIR